MANTVIALKKSATPGNSPSALSNGEIALNYADGKIFYKNSTGSIVNLTFPQSNDFGVVNAAGTLLVSDTQGDVFTINTGNNIIITGDAVTDSMTIAANLDPVYVYASTKLANTSGVTFGGELTISGNLTSTRTMFALHFDNTSDINLKENISPINDPMIIISQLNPVSFNFKSSQRKSYGLIAQDVEQVLPDIVTIREDGIKSLSYIDIISFLIGAVQQQQKDINTLNRRIDELTSKQ